MSDAFLKALRFQDKLDEIYPERNWPAGARKEPEPHVVEVIRLYRKGYTNVEICEKLGRPRRFVSQIIRRSGCR